MRFVQAVVRALYPENSVCIACGALRVDDVQTHLCGCCLKELTPMEGPFCPRCGRQGWAMVCPNCLVLAPDALDARVSAFAYGKTTRALVRALKYSHVTQAADALAEAMVKALPDLRFDGLVPVPLHKNRHRQRGFNQARALCEAVSRRTGLPVLDALTRERATKTQTHLTREGRTGNVRGAFFAHMTVEGLSLLLIDDVLTTGATALACAEALRAAGASHLTLLTAAQAQFHADD